MRLANIFRVIFCEEIIKFVRYVNPEPYKTHDLTIFKREEMRCLGDNDHIL